MTRFANHIRLKPSDAGAKRRLIRDLFSTKRVHLLVATGKTIVGYALYFYTYSSFVGKPSLFVEDLFVLRGYRALGVGRLLLMRCTQDALKHDCDSMKSEVLVWNSKAIAFFRIRPPVKTAEPPPRSGATLTEGGEHPLPRTIQFFLNIGTRIRWNSAEECSCVPA